MTGYEVCIVSVASPCADIDNIKGLVDEVADGGELGQYERGGCGECREVERIGAGRAKGRQGGEADVDILGL